MRLLSRINVSGFDYFIILCDTKSAQEWYLVSQIHPKNYAKVGDAQLEDSLITQDLYKTKYKDYIVEAIKRSKKTGKVQTLKKTGLINILDKVLASYIDARDLAYPKENILSDSSESSFEDVESFSAMYGGYLISYKKDDGIYSSLSFKSNGLDLDFSINHKLKLPKGLEFEDEVSSGPSNIDLASLPNINVNMLASIVDLSWYMDLETGKVKKDYRVLCTLVEFESQCVTPMIRYIVNEIKSGRIPFIYCDTETNGLNIYDLAKDNPSRSSISTIQFAWKDDQGVLICLDMEFLDNVNKEYVMQRFKNLFDYYVRTPESTIEVLYEEDGTKLEVPEVYTIRRTDIELGAHNSPFDSRVTLSEGTQYYFDQDTLQMAFNVDPTVTRGSKKLKRLTRFFFHEETPELDDILGKGNEDKFRYLKDKLIVAIYGCADVDYGRKLKYVLEKLMSPKMYRSYRSIDPITWYLVAQSEYWGMPLDEDGLQKNSTIIKSDINSMKDLIYTYVGFVLHKRMKILVDQDLDTKGLTTSMSFDTQEGDLDFLKDVTVSKHKFKLKGDEVRKVMYNLLKYPVLVKTDSGQGAVNTEAFKKLLHQRNDSPSNILKKNILSADGETILVKAELFNSYKYPLCYLLQVYSGLDKEYTTYYKGFEREDLEGVLHKGISTTNIETRRMSSAAQQIKKNLKALIKPPNDEWYACDWDFDQVEARIFTSEAGDKVGIEKYKDNEKDYHTENAALMFQTLAHLVTKWLRTIAKAIGFGLPYGLSDYKLTERIFTVFNKVNEAKTKELRIAFEKVNHICMQYLEEIRKSALKVVDVPVELKRFWGLEDDAKVGMVYNKNGFYRYFPLDDVLGNKKLEGSVMRAAGNYPIQSFASDLFKFVLKRFYDRLVKEGLDDKVRFTMYIHDELLFFVHKSVDPRLIAKLCAEECMIRLKGHTNYFIGLNFGNTWLDCKDDHKEIPSGLLMRISRDLDTSKLNAWTEDPNDLIVPLIDQYKKDRISEYLREIQPSLPSEPIDVTSMFAKFTNYKVRGYIYDFDISFSPRTFLNSDNEAVDDDDDKLLSCLCKAIKFTDMPDVKFLIDGVVQSSEEYIKSRLVGSELNVKSDNDKSEEFNFDFDDDINSVGEDDYWSLDGDSEDLDRHVHQMYELDDEDDSDLFELPKRSYKYVKRSGYQIVLNCPRPKNVKSLEDLVSKYKSPGGKMVVIETVQGNVVMQGKYDINFETINDFLKEVN